MTLQSNMGTNGGVCGQNFVKLIPAQGDMDYPRLVVMDPMLVRMVTHPEDCSLVMAFIIEYPTINDWQKRQIVARIDPNTDLYQTGDFDINDTWTITNYLRRGQLGSWVQQGITEEWPYPFPPIFTNQNLPNPNEPWGVPDLTPDLIDSNKVLNFIQSNTSRILKFHAHPKTWVTGAGASQIQIAVDDVICFADPQAKIGTVEMHGELTASLNFAAQIRDDMDEQSRVPGVALGRIEALPRGNISGVALQLLFQPLIEKTIIKRRLYGRLIREISRAALVLAGLIDVSQYNTYKVGLQWSNLLPADDLVAAQTAVLLDQLGVSQTTLLANLGFNAEDEQTMRQLEQTRAIKMQSTKPTAQEAINTGLPMPQPNAPAEPVGEKLGA